MFREKNKETELFAWSEAISGKPGYASEVHSPLMEKDSLVLFDAINLFIPW